jgi:hypothetical protein
MNNERGGFMQEQWKQWKPVQGLANKYYIESAFHTSEGLRLFFFETYNAQKRLQIIFENPVEAYRNTDESYDLALIDMLDAHYGTSFYGDWTFFKVENSLYMKWLFEQSKNSVSVHELTHFAFITSNFLFEVIAHHELHIIFMNELTPHTA